MIKISKKFKRIVVKATVVTILPIIGFGVANYQGETKIHNLEKEHSKVISDYENKIKDLEVYKGLYEDTTKELAETKQKYEESSSKLANLESQIRISKEKDKKYNKTNFADKDLSEYPIYTIDEMNEWIAERAPKGSSFIGKGEEFLIASQEADLDPRYLIAHAALETGWGVSRICKDKNNYFGIGAYNHDPYNKAKTFNSAESGIIAGAVWISNNYTKQGQNTLNKMIYGEKKYAIEDDGSPAQSWIDKMISMIY